MGANGDRPLILGTVGTDHHPYDRFVQWLASWAAANPGARVVVQSGSSTPVDGVECHPLVPVHELDLLINEARVVVTHAGPSTLLQIRRSGRLPIVAPRRPELGEWDAVGEMCGGGREEVSAVERP